jgi:hypothetical protein
MKKLVVDWGELSVAFDNTGFDISYYLNTDTGQVLMVTDEDRRCWKGICDRQQGEHAPEVFDLELALAQSDLPDWQQEGVRTVDFVETHYGRRVIAIPQNTTYEAYDVIQDFIATIEDRRLYEQLLQVTQGRGAFGRFRAILSEHLAEEQRWYAFEENRLRQQIADWLAEEGIEPINGPEQVASAAVPEDVAARFRPGEKDGER